MRGGGLARFGVESQAPFLHEILFFHALPPPVDGGGDSRVVGGRREGNGGGDSRVVAERREGRAASGLT